MHASERQLWIDAVRAIAVILVVLYHYLLWAHVDINGPGGPNASVWGDMRTVAARVRMPLLMAVSGFLATGAIQRGWVGVRLRFVANYWLYFVWLVAYFLFHVAVSTLVPEPGLPINVTTVGRLVEQALMPFSPLWFIVAMAVFPLVVWCAEKLSVPAWVMIIASLAIWGWGIYGEPPAWLGKFLRTFVFFAVGYYARRTVPYLAKLGWASGLLLAASTAVLLKVGSSIIDRDLAGLFTSLAAIVTVAVLGPVMFRTGVHTRVMGLVGRRTLDIYVLHPILISVLMLVLRDRSWLAGLTDTRAGDFLFAFASVAVVVSASLLLGQLLRKIPGVMSLPKLVERRLRSTR